MTRSEEIAICLRRKATPEGFARRKRRIFRGSHFPARDVRCPEGRSNRRSGRLVTVHASARRCILPHPALLPAGRAILTGPPRHRFASATEGEYIHINFDVTSRFVHSGDHLSGGKRTRKGADRCPHVDRRHGTEVLRRRANLDQDNSRGRRSLRSKSKEE